MNYLSLLAAAQNPKPCLKYWAQKIGTQKTVNAPALLPEEAFGTLINVPTRINIRMSTIKIKYF
jgi:hypothetical protein